MKKRSLDSNKGEPTQSYAFVGYRDQPQGYFGPADFDKPGEVPAVPTAALPGEWWLVWGDDGEYGPFPNDLAAREAAKTCGQSVRIVRRPGSLDRVEGDR